MPPIEFRFGGGINTRASIDAVNVREATSGRNFLADLDLKDLVPRPTIQWLGRAPNNAQINGFAQLDKLDGTTSQLVQAGEKVYVWDGATGFTDTGASIAAGARLRGHWEHHNWTFTLGAQNEVVLITDLALQQPVMQWDGTTLQNVSFTDGTNAVDLKAKYCVVSADRAIFGNVESPVGTVTPQVVVASKTEDYRVVSSQRPADSLNDGDPFAVTTSDLKAVNGMVPGFGELVLSTQNGRIQRFLGTSAKDANIVDFYSQSNASGDEALVWAGNDAVYGRLSTIESVRAINNFADVTNDDLSRFIAGTRQPNITGYDRWTVAYNSRTKRAFFFAQNQPILWVWSQSIHAQNGENVTPEGSAGLLSPWMAWTTDHPMGYQPTAVMPMLEPGTREIQVYCGDNLGNVYVLEGDQPNDSDETTSYPVRMERQSVLVENVSAFTDAKSYLYYKRRDAVDVGVQLDMSGEKVTSDSVTVRLRSATGGAYYNGPYYYNDGTSVYGLSQFDRIVREPATAIGSAELMQLTLTSPGGGDYAIQRFLMNVDEATSRWP